jgi:hypothetical protein
MFTFLGGRYSIPNRYFMHYCSERKNLYPSLYPDVETIPKDLGDEFLKGHPAVLAPRSCHSRPPHRGTLTVQQFDED